LAQLSYLGLYHQDEQVVNFRLYNMTIHTWTTIRIGHIITLRDGNRVFLKRAYVIHCLEFDNLLSRSRGHNPHFSRNLPRDRAYIRQALKAKKIEAEIDIPCSEEEQEVEPVEKDECRSWASQDTSTQACPAPPLLVPQKFKTVIKVEPIVIDLTISDSDGDTQPITMTHKRSRPSGSWGYSWLNFTTSCKRNDITGWP